MKIKTFAPYLAGATTIFSLSVLVGFLLSNLSPWFTNLIISQLEEKFSPLSDASPLKIFSFIFFNNTTIDGILLLSFFLVGLVPLIILTGNGLMIGIVLGAFSQEEPLIRIAALIVPHGLLEIPSFLLAAATSWWLSVKMFQTLFSRQPFGPPLLFAIKIFFFLIIPLNLVAAFIETYITPLIYALSFPR